jgi:3-deoxy-D-manno-octulosonic-acid transferase
LKPPAASNTRRALGLTAYLTYARGGASGPVTAPLARPSGPLVWAHAEGPRRGRALASLCARLRQQRPEVTVVHSGEMPAQAEAQGTPLPREHLGDCEAFLARLKPDVLLWASQSLRPALLHSAAAQGCRLIGLDAADAPWPTAAPRWLPDPAAGALSLFDHLFTHGNAATRRLRRMGVAGPVLHDAAPLIDTAPPLDCPTALHEEMAAGLTGRPVWLAAHLRGEEIGDVLSAHRHAVRLAHRLLLIVAPASARDAAMIARAVRASQMRVCDWEAGEMPDEYTQVLMAGSPEELGLWYRLAPLAFLGGSLLPGVGGQDPFEAAALGAAILYGPNVGKYLDAYSLLVEAGAARIVRDADSLGTAVSHLVAPDQAAGMAHAGWDVISCRAALVDEVLALVGEALDSRRSA